jgi:RNA polymerase sigma-B factor
MDLLRAYQENPTVEIRNQIVRLNAGLVRKIAHRLSRQCLEPFEDLQQIGFMGLIHAIERFQFEQGYAFSSFAVPYIRGEILHYLRDRGGMIKVPRRWQDMQRDGQRIKAELTKTLQRQPTDREIAEAMGISLNEWCQVKVSFKNRLPLSLDATVGQQVDCPVTLGEILPDTEYQIFQNLEEDRQQLQNALDLLEDKTRTAIEFVFLKNLSRKEVAKRIGVSPMTVSRRIQRGMDQLIKHLQPQVLQPES